MKPQTLDALKTFAEKTTRAIEYISRNKHAPETLLVRAALTELIEALKKEKV